MHTEDFVIDQGSDGHTIENILELFPHADGVATLAFIIEAIDAVDLATLVITAQQKEVLLKLDLVCEEEDDGLKRILATIDVVTHEQIVSVGWLTTNLE